MDSLHNNLCPAVVCALVGSSHPCRHLLPSNRRGETIGRPKAGKPMGWDKASLSGGGKQGQRQAVMKKQSLLTSSHYLPSNAWKSIFGSTLVPPFIAEHDATGCGMSLEVSCGSCVPPQFLGHPQPPFAGRVGWGRKDLSPVVSTAEQWLKHLCVINSILARNPNKSTIWATLGKISSIQPWQGCMLAKPCPWEEKRKQYLSHS